MTAPLGQLGNEFSPAVPSTALTPMLPHDAFDGVVEAHADTIARDGVGPTEADPERGAFAFEGKMPKELAIRHPVPVLAPAGS